MDETSSSSSDVPPGGTRGDTAQQSVAMLIAAARDDRHAMAILSQAMDVTQARDAAVFCAYVAAEQFTADETRRSQPGLYETVLKEVALRLAVRGHDPHGP